MLLRVGCRNPVISPQCGINVVSQYTPKWQSYMIRDTMQTQHLPISQGVTESNQAHRQQV